MIIAHKPTALLDNTRQEKAIALMQEYVRNRGVLMDPNEPLIMRRKRTLIFTTLSDQVAALADDIYVVEGGRLTKV
jgi:ABC-type lipoprotein export system ATPase subunit